MASAEYHQRWREANRESTRASSRRHAAKKRRAQPAAVRASSQRYWNSAAGVLVMYRRNASARGLSFDMDKSLVADLISDVCFYCGASPAPRNGIDRVDNSRGYFFGNVVSCCAECNRIKKNLSAADLIDRCRRIADRFSGGAA